MQALTEKFADAQQKCAPGLNDSARGVP